MTNFCTIVWDGVNFTVPEALGKAREDQLASTPLDNLAELSGRTCYDSLGSGRKSTDYHAHIIEVKHGCYDIETDVLTYNGWKNWSDVTSDDMLATRTENGFIEYHKPKKLIKYKHKGKMYRVKGRGINLLVTPDHKMLACKTTTIEGRKRKNYQLYNTEELGVSAHAYIKDADWHNENHKEIPSNVAALLGFSIGDGNISPHSHAVTFHLKRQRKIIWLKKLTEDLKWSLNINEDHYSVKIPIEWIELFKEIYCDNSEKQIPQHLITDCSKSVLESLFEGLMQSDGSIGKTGDSYDTTSLRLAGQVQHLCLHIGIAANVCYVRTDRSKSFGDKPLIRLSIVSRELRPEVNRYKGSKRKSEWISDWEGDVFCAEVENNTLYVRRNGQPVWSGNSVYEHSNITFLIPNLSVPDFLACCECLLNRPGVFAFKIIHPIPSLIMPGEQPQSQIRFDLRITANMRAIREWFEFPMFNAWGELLGKTLQNLAKEKAPLIFADIPFHAIGENECKVVMPEIEQEMWVSIFFTNVSRGFSHELVRHKFFTAVSQRSTRYVDENESSWAYHPLIKNYLNSGCCGDNRVDQLLSKIKCVEFEAKEAYAEIVKYLQEQMIKNGIDKFTARKQARGAARGFLGNALMTELIFSANIHQWKWMIKMRASRHADAEIRLVFNEVYELLNARFPNQFNNWTKHDCPDGIGYELQEPV